MEDTRVQILKFIEIENCYAHLQSKEYDLQYFVKQIEDKEDMSLSYFAV